MRINKLISHLVMEMVMLVAAIIGTYFVWDNIDMENEAKMAYAYSNYDARLTLNTKNSIEALIPESDDDAENNVILSLANSNSIIKKYDLYFVYNNKVSQLNKDYIKISLNGNAHYLNELESYESGMFTYYKLESSSIKKKSDKDLNIKIYLAIETPNSEQGKTASFTFNVEEI